MRYLFGFICVLALVLVACGGDDDTRSNVSGQEAETHCRQWCDAGGCDTDYSDPAQCLQQCRYNLAFTCGEHVAAGHNCVTALGCSDPFNDCDVHLEAANECTNAVQETRRACPEGTDPGGCNVTGGDCNARNVEAYCRFEVDAGQCTDYEGCVANNGICPPEARP
jgi:hypothetical protein